MTPVKKERAM